MEHAPKEAAVKRIVFALDLPPKDVPIVKLE